MNTLTAPPRPIAALFAAIVIGGSLTPCWGWSGSFQASQEESAASGLVVHGVGKVELPEVGVRLRFRVRAHRTKVLSAAADVLRQRERVLEAFRAPLHSALGVPELTETFLGWPPSEGPRQPQRKLPAALGWIRRQLDLVESGPCLTSLGFEVQLPGPLPRASARITRILTPILGEDVDLEVIAKTSAPTPEQEDQALAKAMEDARRQRVELARLLGVPVGRITAIQLDGDPQEAYIEKGARIMIARVSVTYSHE